VLPSFSSNGFGTGHAQIGENNDDSAKV